MPGLGLEPGQQQCPRQQAQTQYVEGPGPASAGVQQQHHATADNCAQGHGCRADGTGAYPFRLREDLDRQGVQRYIGPCAEHADQHRQEKHQAWLCGAQVMSREQAQGAGVAKYQQQCPVAVAGLSQPIALHGGSQKELEHGGQAGQLHQADLGATPAVLAHDQRQADIQINQRRGERQVEPAQQQLLGPPCGAWSRGQHEKFLMAPDQAQARLPERATGVDRGGALVTQGAVVPAGMTGEQWMLVQSRMRMISIEYEWR